MRFIAVACLLLLETATVGAQTLDWHFMNRTNEQISVQFYSRTRSHVWPNASSVYFVAPDRQRYTERIACQRGEYVCYGAWVEGVNMIWGVGRDGREGCRDCCYYCNGGNTQVIPFDP